MMVLITVSQSFGIWHVYGNVSKYIWHVEEANWPKDAGCYLETAGFDEGETSLQRWYVWAVKPKYETVEELWCGNSGTNCGTLPGTVLMSEFLSMLEYHILCWSLWISHSFFLQRASQRWIDTKNAAVKTRQEIGNFLSQEVSALKKAVVSFEVHILNW